MGRSAPPDHRAEPVSGFSKAELYSYSAVFVVLAGLELAASFLPRALDGRRGASDDFFGFSQLRWWSVVLGAAVAGVIVRVERVTARTTTRVMTPTIRVALASVFGVAFFGLRSWFINPDGALLPMKFMVDVPAKGFHATHDEMLELYVHSKVWAFMNAHFGWNVDLSYQVVSCAAGAVFIYVLLSYVERVVSTRWPAALLACLAGGYMQLFFGDIENYTLMTALVMSYFLAAARNLDGHTSLTVPSLLLAGAMMFHLEAGFLLPSLGYLLFVAAKRGQYRQIALASIAFGSVVAGTLLFFHASGLPIDDLFSKSHAFGDGGHFLQMLVTPSVNYYFQIVNLAFLLAPAWVIVIVLLAFKRIPFDAVNVHLLIASAVMGAFVLGWNALLGVYNDWNLFAMAAVPILLLAWRNIFRIAGSRPLPLPVVALIALFVAHSYSWVIGNHVL